MSKLRTDTEFGGKWVYELHEDNTASLVECKDEKSSNIVIPSSIDSHPVTGICTDCFHVMDNIESVHISAGIKRVQYSAFNYCKNLVDIYVGPDVESMASTFEADCLNIRKVDVDTGNSHFRSENGVLFSKDMSVLIYYPHEKPGEKYVIPRSVKIIADWAIMDCFNLREVHVSPMVRKIGKGNFYYESSLVIKCRPGSMIEKWADEHSLYFEYLLRSSKLREAIKPKCIENDIDER